MWVFLLWLLLVFVWCCGCFIVFLVCGCCNVVCGRLGMVYICWVWIVVLYVWIFCFCRCCSGFGWCWMRSVWYCSGVFWLCVFLWIGGVCGWIGWCRWLGWSGVCVWLVFGLCWLVGWLYWCYFVVVCVCVWVCLVGVDCCCFFLLLVYGWGVC